VQALFQMVAVCPLLPSSREIQVCLCADDVTSAPYKATVQVEASQQMIRIVGLSATLPNYTDVADFLGVRESGLFHFGPEYRPVPLAMSFVGVSEKNFLKRVVLMVDVTYERIVKSLKEGYQAMVFVHSRKDTAKTAEQLAERAASAGTIQESCLDTRPAAKKSCPAHTRCNHQSHLHWCSGHGAFLFSLHLGQS
jgi:replicative superfamily II helicase